MINLINLFNRLADTVAAVAVTIGRAIVGPRYKVVEVASGGKVYSRMIRGVTDARRLAERLNRQYGHDTFRAVCA